MNPADFKVLLRKTLDAPFGAAASLDVQFLRHVVEVDGKDFADTLLLHGDTPQKLRFCGDPAFNSNRPE